MKKYFTVQEMCTMALLAALLCVSSYISIQLPISLVPITAQTLVVNLIALLLKPKKAGITVGIWCLLGIIGLPVFSGGKAGFGTLAGPTGGFILSFIVMAILVAMIRGKNNNYFRNLIAVIIGIAITYLIGTPWMKAVAGMDWKTALMAGVVPFLIGDVIKAVLATSIAKPLYHVVNAKENSL